MTTQGFKKATLAAMIATFGLAGCETTATNDQQAAAAVGGLLGAIGGGFIGNEIGDGRGRDVATVAGSVLGGLVGAGIGLSLTQQDDAFAQQTTQQTLTSAPVNQPVRWQNPQTGVYGDVVATTPVYQQPYYAPQATQASYGTTYSQPQTVDCRDYKQTIFVDNQRYETAVGTACRQPDGTWRIQS